ncbi:hypothetical protein J3R30DRAFT_3464435 [Lentinula aciculospora]|uniref:Uncharacterized protein n=1 Tax=Lentinula aciculospora TaxID=153920 RepID=A0A9W9DQ78_9AGAR|nr:hypothetical protein J3R30DRAFT_3464435 [Lentinula aciculospora]
MSTLVMRLRLQTSNTSSNLPQLKAWFAFSVTDENPQRNSVADLKKLICSSIKSFSNANITFRELGLELDNFELLDELPAEEVLRDGDLLLIKRREIHGGLGKKRKAEDDGSNISGKRPRASKSKTRPQHDSIASSSCSSSSLESDPSSSETDPTTDSDSDSSEHSSTDSNSSSNDSKIKTPKSVSIKHTAPVTHVPPGLGSLKTRKRNIRRRLKKKHEVNTFTSVPTPPKRITGVNIAPLGSKTNSLASTSRASAAQISEVDPLNDPLNLTMFSLGNKNKKKGYKYALALPTTQKKVFNNPDASAAQENEMLNGSLPLSATIFTSAPEHPLTHQRRVIPPSELQSLGKLPKNIFVTSVDVEEGLWNNSKKKKKQRRKQWEEEHSDFVTEVTQHGEELPFTLDYGIAEGELASGNTLSVPNMNSVDAEDTKSTLIWSVVENDFEAFPQVTLDSLRNGKLVAWKALALNPATYSPEVLLHIATVMAVSNEPPWENPYVAIRRLVRPGWEELDVEDVEGTHMWETVKQMGWRAVNEIMRP